jgi:hypothetical protein
MSQQRTSTLGYGGLKYTVGDGKYRQGELGLLKLSLKSVDNLH